MADSNPFAELLTAILQTRQNNYSNAAALALLVYDIFLTMEQEVAYIWGASWSIPKTLYLFGRYYGVCYLTVLLSVGTNRNLTVPFCRAYFWYYGFGGSILFTSMVNVIFVLRIHALYNRRQKVLAFLVFLFCCELIGELLITIVAVKRTSQHASVTPPGVPLPGCLSDRNTDFALVGWVPTLTVSASFFLLTVARLKSILHDSDGKLRFSQLKEMRNVERLMSNVIIDGTVFFFLTFAIVLACAVIDLTVKGALAPVGTPWLIATYSFSATRLILNIRRLAASRMTSTTGVSAIEFDPAALTGSANQRNHGRREHPDSYIAYFGE